MFHSGRAWRRVWLLASSSKPGFESAFPFWSEPNLSTGEKLWVQKHLIHSLGCWRPRQNLGRFLKHTGRFMKCDWTHESQGWPSTNLDSLTCFVFFYFFGAVDDCNISDTSCLSFGIERTLLILPEPIHFATSFAFCLSRIHFCFFHPQWKKKRTRRL